MVCGIGLRVVVERSPRMLLAQPRHLTKRFIDFSTCKKGTVLTYRTTWLQMLTATKNPIFTNGHGVNFCGELSAIFPVYVWLCLLSSYWSMAAVVPNGCEFN